MDDRKKLPLMLCVNCNIRVNNMRRYPALELETKVTSLLCSWVHPRIVTKDDYVCEKCLRIASTVSNEDLLLEVFDSDDQKIQPNNLGHNITCLLCGISLLRRQKDKILRDNPTDLLQSIANIICEKVEPREVTESDHVCHACWLRTKRQACRLNNLNAIKSQDIKIEPQEYTQLQEIQPPDTSKSKKTVDCLVLPNHRRAPNSCNRCVFPNCRASSLHRISDKTRAVVLSNHNFYLPPLVRACNDHLRTNMWETLYDSTRSIKTFTAEHIEHALSFINTFNPSVDFENINEVDDKIFDYCMGISKEEFDIIVEELPQITEIKRGRLGLAALFMKYKSGEPNERISSLLHIPRRTLENIMAKVKAVLSDNLVTNNAIINDLCNELIKASHCYKKKLNKSAEHKVEENDLALQTS